MPRSDLRPVSFELELPSLLQRIEDVLQRPRFVSIPCGNIGVLKRCALHKMPERLPIVAIGVVFRIVGEHPPPKVRLEVGRVGDGCAARVRNQLSALVEKPHELAARYSLKSIYGETCY